LILSDSKILRLIRMTGLIKNYVDLDRQIQPAGFDLTLNNILQIDPESWGRIDFTNEKRFLPKYIPLDEIDGGWNLKPGNYIMKTNEVVKLPNGISGLSWPRSSINRCGAAINTATVDPGFEGPLSYLLQVNTKLRLDKNARVVQLVFFKTELSENLYNGVYAVRK